MELVQNGLPFSLNYVAYDQNPGLFVAFQVFDITTGSAVFIQTIAGQYVAFGLYTGVFTPNYAVSTGRNYLIIGAVYLDGTFMVPDPNRSPGATNYQVVVGNSPVAYSFNYGTYDINSGLFLRAGVYDLTTGTPVFVQNVVMSYAALGVYFGLFTGVTAKTYDIVSAVYTDGTYATVDTDRAASCDNFNGIALSSFTTNLTSADLFGQEQSATIIGQAIDAVLEESQC